MTETKTENKRPAADDFLKDLEGIALTTADIEAEERRLNRRVRVTKKGELVVYGKDSRALVWTPVEKLRTDPAAAIAFLYYLVGKRSCYIDKNVLTRTFERLAEVTGIDLHHYFWE